MATIRTTGPSLGSIFRLASQPASTRRCAHCLKAQRCPFSSFKPSRQASKRPLMTETVRPQTLGEAGMMPPTPPRNDGVPETSITAPSPTSSQQQQQQQTTWPPSIPWQKRKDSGPGLSERESEAQKTKPTVNTTTSPAASPTPTPPKKKSKLRPRKAPITVSPAAVTHLRQLFHQPESKMIRIGVKNRGCSGLAYHLEYVDKAGAFDEAVEQDGVKVLIDSKALFSIIGSEMDWMEDKLAARFVFRNPNITEECGCGESFSIS